MRAWGRWFGVIRLTLICMMVVAAMVVASRWGAERFREENRLADIRLFITKLAERLDRIAEPRFQALKAVAANAEVRAVLSGEEPPDNPQVSLVLDTANAVTDSELIWVMGRDGVVRASSRYGSGTLTGVDYGFRPYFKDSLRGLDSIFPAVGAKTLTRGLYLSTPVYANGDASEARTNGQRPIGVAALKIGIAEIDALLADGPGINLLVSPDGVVFAASREAWLFRVLGSISREALERFDRTRQFGEMKLKPMALEIQGTEAAARLRLDNQNFFLLERKLTIDGWKVLTLQPVTRGHPLTGLQKYLLAGSQAVIAALIFFLALLVLNTAKRKESEQAMRASEFKYRSLFENAAEGIFRISHEGRFLSANPALARILGYGSPAELLAQESDFTHDEAEFKDFFETVHDQGSAVRELRLKRKDGESIWAAVSARVVRDPMGKVKFHQGFLLDVTSRRRAQEQLEKMNQHLEELIWDRTRELEIKARELEQLNARLCEMDQMKSIFLSSVSHELRTPLTSMMGFARIITRDFERHFAPLADGDQKLETLAGRIAENLSIIGNEGKRLTRLINDVLDLNKIESGRMDWWDQETGLAEIIEETVRGLDSRRSERPGVTIETRLEKNLPNVYADPDRLKQVMVNLLENAWKFTPRGSIKIHADVSDDGRSVVVKISDTGIGIPKEEQESIFEHFKQVRPEDLTLEKPAGTGLGLSISKQIIEHYNGAITVDSTPGLGSTFTFTIPILR